MTKVDDVVVQEPPYESRGADSLWGRVHGIGTGKILRRRCDDRSRPYEQCFDTVSCTGRTAEVVRGKIQPVSQKRKDSALSTGMFILYRY